MTPRRRSFLSRAALAAGLGLSASAVAARGPDGPATAVIGTYDGGQFEIAAGLELRGDGRFRYELSYGALDEEAEGSWTVTGDAVLLTSDPVTPPRFVLVEEQDAADNRL